MSADTHTQTHTHTHRHTHTHTLTRYTQFPTDAGKWLWLSKLLLDSMPRGLVVGSKADVSGAQFPTMSGFKHIFLYPVAHLIFWLFGTRQLTET